MAFYVVNLPGYSPTISSDGAKIYVGTSGGYFYAIRSSDGVIELQYFAGAAIMSKPAIGGGGVIYFKSANGFVYAIHSNNFTPKWAFPVGTDSTDLLTSPVLYLHRQFRTTATWFTPQRPEKFMP